MTTMQETISTVSKQQNEARFAERQANIQRQIAEQNAAQDKKQRELRIEQIQNTLNGLPARRKQAASQATEAAELAEMLESQVNSLANDYVRLMHTARQSGRPMRLELSSPEAIAYFNGAAIKKGLRPLALAANNRNMGAPLIDVESFNAELSKEEKRLRDELAELTAQG